MLIALTGLHGAGKSYFANNIPSKYGFTIYNKKDIIRYICKNETNRDDWGQWYSEEFNKDAYRITETILSYVDYENDAILDAVHSDFEWGIISNIVPDASLIGVITPEFIRAQRREDGDVEKDKKRIKYWHNGGGCLMTDLDWTINGGASLEFNEKAFEEFLQYVRRKQLAIQGHKVEFSHDKTERIIELMQESDLLDKKISSANSLLSQYRKDRALHRGGKQNDSER